MYSNLEHKYRYSILRREILIIMVSRVLTFEHHYMRGSRIFFKGRGPRDNFVFQGWGGPKPIFSVIYNVVIFQGEGGVRMDPL